MGDRLGRYQIGYRLARLQRGKLFFFLEWVFAVYVLTFIGLPQASLELFLIIVIEFVPIAILFQWLFITARYSGTPGYLVFLTERFKKKSVNLKDSLPFDSYDTLMGAIEDYGNKLTSGHANELTAALKGLTPQRKVNDPPTFSEIRYAIKLKLIYESYARPHSERKQPFVEIAETLHKSVSSLDKVENDCLEIVFTMYDGLSDGIKSAASLINPESISYRIREWQLTTYRIGIISAFVLTGTAIVAIF